MDGSGRPVEGALLVGPRRTRGGYEAGALEEAANVFGEFDWQPRAHEWGPGPAFTVRAAGYATTPIVLSANLVESLRAGGDVGEFVVELRPGFVVEGTVRGEHGARLEGVFVIPEGATGAVPAPEVEMRWRRHHPRPTGPDGRFRVEGLDPAVVRRVFSSFGDQVTGPHPLDATAVASGVVKLDIVVPTPRTVDVRVRILAGAGEEVWGLDGRYEGPGDDPGLITRSLGLGWHRLWLRGPLGYAEFAFDVPADSNGHSLAVDPRSLTWIREPWKTHPDFPDPPPPENGVDEGS